MNPYRKPISIKPASVIREKSVGTSIVSDGAVYFYLLLRTLLLSIILAGLSIAIGLYSYRIYSVNPTSMVDVMDAIFKQAIPSTHIIRITAVSGLIFAFLFYTEYVISQLSHRAERVSGFIRFMTGLMLIAWVDIYLYKIDFYRIFVTESFPKDLFGTVAGQIISIVCIILLMPVFRKLVILGSFSMPQLSLADKTRTILNYGWYYILSFLLLLWTTYLATLNHENQSLFNFWNLELPVVRSGVFLAALGFSALFLRPPASLGINRSFSFIRLILAALSILGVGFFYSQGTNSELSLIYISVAVILTWLSQPIIHLLC